MELDDTASTIQAWRTTLRWSQQDLAEQAGLDLTLIAALEAGTQAASGEQMLAIGRALKRNALLLVNDGGGIHLQLTFFRLNGQSTLAMTFPRDDLSALREFAALFGSISDGHVTFRAEQQATADLKARVAAFVDQRATRPETVHLRRMEKMIRDLADDEFFLLLPAAPASTAEQLACEQHVTRLNHPGTLLDLAHPFEALFQHYDISAPRTDRHHLLGNPVKQHRRCRFCHRTMAEGATFEQVAHAAPRALGNVHLKLADECDQCNGHFGAHVEPTLTGLLGIHRVYLGIEGYKGDPTFEYEGARMRREGETMVVMSDRHASDDAGVLSIQLGPEKPMVLQRFYQGLAKIALSVIPAEQLPALRRTVEWVRYDAYADRPLPKVATTVVPFPFSREHPFGIRLYIRKSGPSRLPHVVGEFTLGCFVYVFVLPFSDNDDWDLVEFFEDDTFKTAFSHYFGPTRWTLRDFGNPQCQPVIQTIRVVPSSTAGADR